MIRSKVKLIALSIAALFLLSFLTSGILLLRYVPDNNLSIGLFKTVYILPIGKKSFLEFYSPVREYGIGYVPKEINDFLIYRIENSTDESEISAIANFYAIQASGHRIGYLINISEPAKMKLVNQLVKELDDEATLIGKLMLLEEIRTSKGLGKGSISIEGIKYPRFSTLREFDQWFYEQSAPIVIPKYQEWWNSNLSWEEKKKINPLQDTNIKVSECCG